MTNPRIHDLLDICDRVIEAARELVYAADGLLCSARGKKAEVTKNVRILFYALNAFDEAQKRESE